ncbi:hypothetical protein [Pandoraea anhela]|uniref:Uncharacterized protein n=1 Tax=Pandoraea anhela TaxID=2508295 RepID=A0A5E4XS11_9BURK|nr:hypothetical protein [Pandoraea anhela]VVE39120.1 hypothetical protein PAN31108_04053 [Pandoraea anhela]
MDPVSNITPQISNASTDTSVQRTSTPNVGALPSDLMSVQLSPQSSMGVSEQPLAGIRFLSKSDKDFWTRAIRLGNQSSDWNAFCLHTHIHFLHGHNRDRGDTNVRHSVLVLLAGSLGHLDAQARLPGLQCILTDEPYGWSAVNEAVKTGQLDLNILPPGDETIVRELFVKARIPS